MCWRHWRPGLPCATGTHYDGYGRLDQMIMPSPTTPGANAPCHVPYASGDDCEVYGYDSAGNMTSKRNRSGLSIAMVYDALSRETSRTVPDNPAYAGNYARTLTSTYDLASRMWDLTADGQTLRNRYDTAGRQNQVQDSLLNALGGTIGNVGYGYDAASNRTSVAFDASQGTWTTTSTFDTGERLATVVNAGSTLAQLGYDPLARLTGTTFLDSSSVGYAYEADDDLQTLTQNFTAGTLTLGYTRNGAHQIIGLTVTDPTYLMKQVGASASYVPNGLNQYTQVAGTALTYDTNGNLIGDGTSTYSFDEENRLRQAVTGGVTSVYAYDPMGRRRSKTVGSTTTYFVNDGANELAELSSTGIRQRSWAYAVGMDNRIAMYDDAGGTGWRFYHVNHQGSVLFTTRQGTGGAIADQYSYGAYGEPLPGAPASVNPFRYTGRYLDAESGLYYYRARYYSPKLGRFLQTDPIGTEDDISLYAYLYNDPLDSADPAGTLCIRGINAGDEFCRRSERYKQVNADPRVSRATNFFAAAAIVTNALGGAPQSEFMHTLSASLEQANMERAGEIRSGHLYGMYGRATNESNTAEFVHFEQTKVQAALDALRVSDPTKYAREVASANAKLNGPLQGLASLTDRQFAAAVKATQLALGRALDFANQGDREVLGKAVAKEADRGSAKCTGSHILECN